MIDTSHGKRSCFLDLSDTEDMARLRELVRDTDVFSQGYRPGMLDGLGFGPEALAAHRPGIVYVSINCYGADGPFSPPRWLGAGGADDDRHLRRG